MDLDTTPITLTTTWARYDDILRKLTIEATDTDGVRWTGILHCHHPSGQYWWSQTLADATRGGRSYPLVSHYDGESDEWWCTVGNYSIKSKEIRWIEGWL